MVGCGSFNSVHLLHGRLAAVLLCRPAADRRYCAGRRMSEEAPEKQRVIDTSAREARLAVAGVAGALEPIRTRIAVISRRAERRPTASDVASLKEECAAIAAQLARLRTDLISSLIDKPHRVLSNTRVTDIEKALDNLEAALASAVALLH